MEFEITNDEAILIKKLLILHLDEKKRRILRVRKNITDEYFDDDIRTTLETLLEGLMFEKNRLEKLLKKFNRNEVMKNEM